MKIAFVMYNVLSTERMSVMLLSALAKRKFPYAKVEIFVYSDGNLKEQMKAFKPDIVGFSSMTGEHAHYLKIASEIRGFQENLGYNPFLIMGGPHCTFAPEILKGSALDAIGVGECDDAWPELLVELEAGRAPDRLANIVTQENFSQMVVPINHDGDCEQPELIGIAGIKPRRLNALKREGYVKYRALNMKERVCRDPINHDGCLDHLPFLDWEMYLRCTNFDRFNSLGKRTIMTRRGCPFPCTYCFNRVFNALYEGSTTIHNYSIDRVINECVYVGERFGAEFWKFYDDIFTFFSKNKEGRRLREFAEKWPRLVGLPFFVLTRADLVARDPDILRLLKQAGCVSVTMSIEGGNEYVRNRVLERSMPDSDVIFAHHLAWDLGIKTFSNVIFSVPVSPEEIKTHGLPARSIDRDLESVKLAMRAKVHFLECPILAPYPGTKLGKYCEDKGFFDGDPDKLPQSYQNVSQLGCFSPREKKTAQNLALLAMWCVFFASRENIFVRKIISPIFFWLVSKIMIYLPGEFFTKIYFLMYVVLQQWLCAAEIYRPKNRPPVKVFKEGFFTRLRYEFMKQFPKRKTA